MTSGLWRAAYAVPVGLAAYAFASHLALRLDWPLSRWLFPLSVLLGGAAAAALCRPVPGASPGAQDPAARIHRVVPWLVALFLGSGLAILVYGAVATPDREWDGLVSWSLRARYLAPPADLSHPVFTDPAVYAHSFEYPLLQPLCLGACQDLLGALPGRLFFPAVYLAFLALIAATARELGLWPTERRVLVLAFGATPMWYSTGSGAVDSGYAELLLAFFLATGAAGILTRRPALVASAALCLPLVKPEGLPYAGLLAVTAIFAGSGRRCSLAAIAGLTVATALWLPLQSRLGHRPPGVQVTLLPILTAVVLIGLQELRRRRDWRPRTWILIGALALALLGTAAILQGTTGRLPLLGEFAGNLVEVPRRLGAVPTLCLGYLDGFISLRSFGLLYVILLPLLCVPEAWRRAGPGLPHRGILGFFLAGIAAACLAVFLGDDTDWKHVFGSRFDRLLLQWVGVGWLLLGPWAAVLLRPPADEEAAGSVPEPP